MREKMKKMWIFISPVMYNISPIFATKVLYLFSMKKRLNLKNPKTFNEKLQWLKLYWEDPRVAKCADKYELREYAKICGLDRLLNEVYGVYKDVDEIDFDSLPNRFALKGTHGSGYNLICSDKRKLDIKNVKKIANKWLKSRYAYVAAEVHYDKIEPRLIIEKFIEGNNGKSISDYKIFCFNGKAKLTMVCEDRVENGRAKYYFYDNSWNILPYNDDSKKILEKNMKSHAEKPVSFDLMIEYAEMLSEPFPFVRVDFYEVDENPILGEMTFFPCGGIDSRLDSKVDEVLGDLIILPNKNYSKRSI